MPSSVAFADEGTSSVSLTCVFSFFSSSAKEARVELIAVTQSSLSQLLLTSVLIDDWNVNFLENVLVFAVLPVVFAPSSGPTALASEVREFVWQTSGADVRCSGEIDWLAQLQNSEIVVECSGVVLRMNVN